MLWCNLVILCSRTVYEVLCLELVVKNLTLGRILLKASTFLEN